MEIITPVETPGHDHASPASLISTLAYVEIFLANLKVQTQKRRQEAPKLMVNSLIGRAKTKTSSASHGRMSLKPPSSQQWIKGGMRRLQKLENGLRVRTPTSKQRTVLVQSKTQLAKSIKDDRELYLRMGITRQLAFGNMDEEDTNDSVMSFKKTSFYKTFCNRSFLYKFVLLASVLVVALAYYVVALKELALDRRLRQKYGWEDVNGTPFVGRANRTLLESVLLDNQI